MEFKNYKCINCQYVTVISRIVSIDNNLSHVLAIYIQNHELSLANYFSTTLYITYVHATPTNKLSSICALGKLITNDHIFLVP
jgi:hypothetical protein